MRDREKDTYSLTVILLPQLFDAGDEVDVAMGWVLLGGKVPSLELGLEGALRGGEIVLVFHPLHDILERLQETRDQYWSTGGPWACLGVLGGRTYLALGDVETKAFIAILVPLVYLIMVNEVEGIVQEGGSFTMIATAVLHGGEVQWSTEAKRDKLCGFEGGQEMLWWAVRRIRQTARIA